MNEDMTDIDGAQIVSGNLDHIASFLDVIYEVIAIIAEGDDDQEMDLSEFANLTE